VLVCHGQVRQRLRDLRLHDPHTRFGKRICETLRPLDPHADFQVLEDTQTVPGHMRVFISRRRTTGRLLNLQGLKR
jgi:hypothetical protein